ESTCSIMEAALFVGEFLELAGLSPVGANCDDGLTHVLSVSSDVLPRGSADRSRYSTQALDACAVRPHCLGYKCVPAFTGAHPKYLSAILRVTIDSGNGDVQCESVPPSVADDDVAAAAQNQGLDPALIGPGQ